MFKADIPCYSIEAGLTFAFGYRKARPAAYSTLAIERPDRGPEVEIARPKAP